MKKPDESIPDQLWRYLQTRYRHSTLKAMFSRQYKPNGKREIQRHSKNYKKYGHN